MNKSLKPLYFTLFFAALVTLGSQVILYFLLDYYYDKVHFWIIIIYSVFLFLILYFLINFYFKKYLTRKINKLLNAIQGPGQNTGKVKTIDFRNNLFDDIDQKVRGWIDENKKEMDKFKILSDYRKQFLGDISHELKTPLFSIQGYLHTLRDGALFDKNKNLVFLEKAIKNSERLESIVSDLDMISRLETGEMNFNFTNFNITKIFIDVFEELEYPASTKNISLEFNNDSKKGLIVNGDQKQIRRVCNNLVSNAIHYGKNKGYVKVGIYPRGEHIAIEVSDNGIGIPEEHLNFLFDRFYRIDASRSRNKGGSGLGLSIVKHIIKRHEQEIQVESTSGKGSIFTFTLLKGK